MEAEIVERSAFSVIGIQVRIAPCTADYPRIWEQQYMPHDAVVTALAAEEGHCAVYFSTDEPGKVDMVAGVIAGAVDSVPEGLVLREVPAAQYARFECGMDAIGATWQGIYSSWLPGNDEYAVDEGKACFELFPPGVHEGTAPIAIHVAVKAK